MDTPYTEQQKQDFKLQYKTRRNRQLLVTVPLILVVVVGTFLRDERSGTIAGVSESIYGPAFLVFVVGLLVFSFFNWRCPACNSYLGRGVGPRFCQKCGVELRS
jgi:hypothetical protein